MDTKKIVLIVLFLLLFLYLQNNNFMDLFGNTESKSKGFERNFTADDFKNALILWAIKNNNPQKAALMEQILRLETGHFKSQQGKLTGSAGMEVGAWAERLKKVGVKPQGTIKLKEGKTGKLKEFIIFATVTDFLEVLSSYLNDYDYARWYSTDKLKQQAYKRMIEQITPKFINSYFK